MIELLTIGTELLLGNTVDTNAAHLATRLSAAGYRVVRHTTVGDDAAAIRAALSAALERSRLVLCTGGLGPTPDDLTRAAAADVYGVGLEPDEGWLDVIAARFAARGLAMPEVNRVQALVPVGATLLPNSAGTAPGLALHDAALGTTILLPGVPREMRTLLEEQVLPYLLRQLGPRRAIRSLTLRTTGIAESALAERIGGALDDLSGLTLAYLPTGLGTDLRLTCWGDPEPAAAEALLTAGAARLDALVGAFVYGEDTQDLAAVVGGQLRARRLRVATAESCTGGLVGARLTAIPGSSDYYLGGVVAYADDAKLVLAGVQAATLREHGAVSEPVARELARGVAERTGAECAIAVTGIAGPGGGSAAKPVGTVWVAVAVPGRIESRLHRLVGSRDEIRQRAAQAALALLRELL